MFKRNCNCSLHGYLPAGNLVEHIPRLYSNYKTINKTCYFSLAQLERMTTGMSSGGKNDMDTFKIPLCFFLPQWTEAEVHANNC